MKKTLVAAAILAASGASFAQVSLTGEATWGYNATTNAAGVKDANASGFGVDTAEIYATATEDIGGGNKVVADLGFSNAGRGTATTGTNFSIAVGGGSMGTLKVATAKGADYLSGGGSSASVVGSNIAFDGKIFGARIITDSISYSVPVGPVSLTLGHREGANLVGLGAGTSGATATTGQRKNWISAKGSFAGFTADAGYAVYDSKDGVGATTVSDTSIYGAANYNFGIAKVGFGFDNAKKTSGSTNDLYLAAAASFGALDLGLEWASRKFSDEFGVGAAGTKTGWALTSKYHLSKRTGLIARTSSWENAVGVADRSTQTDLLLQHTF